MKWYPWLRPHFEQLVNSYQGGRGHRALLIQALPGMGDDALIYAITRFLMCQQPEGHKSCGKCRGKGCPRDRRGTTVSGGYRHENDLRTEHYGYGGAALH